MAPTKEVGGIKIKVYDCFFLCREFVFRVWTAALAAATILAIILALEQ